MEGTSFKGSFALTVESLRRNPKGRKVFTWIGLGLLGFASAALVLLTVRGGDADAYTLLVIMPAAYGIVFLYVVGMAKRERPFESYHESLLKERAALRRRIAVLDETAPGQTTDAADPDPGVVVVRARPATPAAEATAKKAQDIQDIVFLNLNQMEEFYVLTIRQARSAYWSSIIASAVGLATVLGGIWLFYLRDDPNLPLTTISTAAGIITQFLGVTYYFMHRRASDKMNYYYDQLLRTQDTMLAVRLAAEMEDPRDRSTARLSIITRLVGRGHGGVGEDRPAPAREPAPTLP